MLVRRRLFVAALVVSLLLPVFPARAGALPAASGARTAAWLPSLWQQLLAPFLDMLGLAPWGGESSESDLGLGMDPNGGTADSDRGLGMDPNG